MSSPSSTRWIVTPVVSTPAASASSIGCAPGNAGSSEGWTLTIRSGNRARNGRREQMHVAGEHDRLDAVLLEPGRHHEIALLAVDVAVERKGGCRYPRGACTNESVGVFAVGGDGSDREARVDQGLQVRAVPRDEDADHAIRPITSSLGAGSATTAHQPIPRLKTRRSSSSATWRASQSNTGGRGQELHSISACVPSGRTRLRLPRIPPPVMWANAFARPRRARASSR